MALVSFFRFLQAALPPDIPTKVVVYPTTVTTYEEATAYARSQLAGIDRFVLLGESFSGPVAVSLAAEHPSGLSGCILCASFLASPSALLTAFGPLLSVIPVKSPPMALLSRVAFGAKATPQLNHALVEALAATPRRTLVARVASVRSVNVSEAASRIAVPTLYMHATADRLVPARAAQQVLTVVPGSRVAEMDGPHFLLQAAPEASSHAIVSFMKSVNGC